LIQVSRLCSWRIDSEEIGDDVDSDDFVNDTFVGLT
jgi:hypothetical protein